jgi:ATP-binding cassette subfamily B protein
MKIPFKEYWDLLGTYFKPEWKRAGLMGILLVSSIGLQLFIPLIVRDFIDLVIAQEPVETLTRLAVTFLGLALLKETASLATGYIGQDVRWRATNALRRDLARHTLYLDMKFHNIRTPGEMIERIDGDVNELSNFFSQFVIQIFGNVLLLIGVLVMLFREEWSIGAVFLGFCLFTLVVLTRIINYAVGQWEKSRQASAELFGFLEERLAGTEDIAALGAGAYKMRRLAQALTKHMRVSRRAWIKGSAIWMTSLAIFTLGNITAFAMGAWRYEMGVLTIGSVYIIFHYTELLRKPLETITRQMQDLQKAGGSVARIRELLMMRSSARRVKAQGDEALPVPDGALALDFDQVTFSYDETEVTLDNMDFKMAPGQVMGLLGRTGSGKTTMARLLFRLYDPQQGEIRLGGTAIQAADTEQLRERVGMVTQDVQLFRASVRDNLTFFDRSIPDERLIEVLKELELWDWVQNLPEGLDTILESDGGGLSAGEAQLLAFTRVFLRDPGLVILDEASSRLDPATEQLIERAVDKLFKNRTAIIIAHRLATVQRADQIMIIENGKILEKGPRDELAQSDSRFASLLETGMEEVLA